MFYQNSIKDLLSEELNKNTHGILFETVLFNYKSQDEFYQYIDDLQNDFVTHKRFYVPCIIPSFNGEYLGIPNQNASGNNVSLQFLVQTDEFGGDNLEYSTNDYEKVFTAIEEVRKTLIGKYFALGDTLLVTGDETSSNLVIDTPPSALIKTVYFKGKFKDNEITTIFKVNATNNSKLSKTATHIEYVESNSSDVLSVPYKVGTNYEIYVDYGNPTYSLTLNELDDDGNVIATASDTGTLNFLTAKIEELNLFGFYGETEIIGISSTVNDTIENMLLTPPEILIKDFSSDEVVTNQGSFGGTLELTNCFYKGKEGNVVITGKPLLPTSRLITRNGYDYMEFDLQLDMSYSENLKYGNQWRYKLDGYDIIPVDRPIGKTFGSNGVQYLDEPSMVSINSDNVFGITLTFYSEDSIISNRLEKTALNRAFLQNTTFSLFIQQPLYSVTKTVIIESINIQPMLNGFSTYTVSFKEADEEVL